MKTYRVTAVLCEGGQSNENSKCMLLCGLDKSFRIIRCVEWFGCIQHGYVIHPFVLQNGNSFFYGGENHVFEKTNVGERLIKPNEYFTVYSEGIEVIFKIISCDFYEN